MTSLNQTADGLFSSLLSQTRGLLIFRGIIAILFGLFALFAPAPTLDVLIIFFGAYVLADGVLGIIAACTSYKKNNDWWVLLLWGLAGLVMGGITLAMPGITALVLLFYFAAWAMVTGVLQIVAAIRLRHEIPGEGWLLVGGILSVVFGILLFANPLAGMVAMLWLIGIYAVLFGIICIALAVKTKKFVTKS